LPNGISSTIVPDEKDRFAEDFSDRGEVSFARPHFGGRITENYFVAWSESIGCRGNIAIPGADGMADRPI
jgi:hypothetical protein